jgi:hypothetical protein
MDLISLPAHRRFSLRTAGATCLVTSASFGVYQPAGSA